MAEGSHSLSPPPELTAADFAARRRAFAERIGEDAVAILPAAAEQTRSRDTHFPFRQDSDFQYLTGFPEADAIAVIAPGRAEGAFVLFVRPRDPERETWDGRRAGPEGACERHGADAAYPLAEFAQRLPELLAGRGSVHMQLGSHPELDQRVTRCVQQLRELSRRGKPAPEAFVGLEGSLHEMRLIKQPAEIAHLRFAAAVSAQAHVAAMRLAAPGVPEWRLAAEISAVLGRHDLVPGYGSIVGAGDNACILHYVENRDRLQAGELVLIDAGGEYRGYTADITRSFPADGRFQPAQRTLYEIVLAAQQAAIDRLQPGQPVEAMHQAATRVLTQGLVDLGLLEGEVDALIESGAQRRYYMHGTGHWLGMDVHDVGRYRVDDASRSLQAGMVTTVEPGLYIPPDDERAPAALRGTGIRIEDDVLITASGAEVLSAGVPKAVAEIEALMQAARA